jgi:sulfite dehydrogenase (cytochrome) subunit B
VRGALAGAALLLAALALGCTLALADEDTIHLRDGPGRDLTAARCAICHSLDYIPGNAPVMDRSGWQKSIQKMRDKFGAPITDEEARQILDYLAGSYAGKP